MNGFEKVHSCRKLRDFGENPLGPLRNNWNTKNQIPKNDALKSFSWPWNLDNPFPAERFCKVEFFKDRFEWTFLDRFFRSPTGLEKVNYAYMAYF